MEPLDVAVVDIIGGVAMITSCTLREDRTRPQAKEAIKSTSRSYIDESSTDSSGSRRVKWHATVPEDSVDIFSHGDEFIRHQLSCILINR
jgi:hypothetical protein